MKLVITGATGFLGSFVTRAALAAGHAVVGFKRRGSDPFRLADVMTHPCLELVDVDPDTDSIDVSFDGAQVDAVVHTATFYGRGPTTTTTYAQLIDANISLPMRTLHAAIAHGVPTFINTDSYFNKPGKTYNSLQGYSLTKKYFEDWLEHHSDRIRVVNMRLEHLYGPTDGADKFIPTLIDRIARQRVETFDLTLGNQARDFIYVTDAAAAFMLVLERSDAGATGYEYFEIGTGTIQTVKQMAELISQESGSPTLLRFGAIPDRIDEIIESFASPDFGVAYGFEPRVSPVEGIGNLLRTVTR